MIHLHELMSAKNELLLQLEQARGGTLTKAARKLASRAAALEGQIAAELVRVGRPEDAVVNLISEASCMHAAGRDTEALRILENAADLTRLDSVSSWVREFRTTLQSTRRPAAVFVGAVASIRSNALLRRPQVEAYAAISDHFAKTNEHAIVQLPVGCGKTGTMAIIPFDVASGRVLVIAPSLEISSNLYRNFNHAGVDSFWRKTRVLKNGVGPTCAILNSASAVQDADESDIVVTNIQQLVANDSKKWLQEFPPDYFDMVLVDEGHHNVADSWQEALARFPDAKRISFTATPLRSDGKRVEGARVYHFPIADAIREGFVRDIAARRLEPTEIYFEYKGDKHKHSLAEVMKLREQEWFSKGVALSTECNQHIVDASIQCMHELREGGSVRHQIIAAACSVDHAKAIRSLYTERGCEADVLHSRSSQDEQRHVRRRLENGELDVIVHVQMLSEGADYPTLGVASIFRPYRHLVPYVQFVGRVMRVAKQNAPGHPDNRAFIVSHAGLNVDRWWEELRELDAADRDFFAELAHGSREFGPREMPTDQRRRFSPPMRVLDETIEHFIQEHFLPADSRAVVDDLIRAMQLRGIDLDVLGVSRETLEKKLLEHTEQKRIVSATPAAMVQPQVARQQARRRLDERVRAGAKEVLNELKLSVPGFDLPRRFRATGGTNNLAVAIILINQEVLQFLNIESKTRDILTTEQLRSAHDSIDSLVDAVVAKCVEKG